MGLLEVAKLLVEGLLLWAVVGALVDYSYLGLLCNCCYYNQDIMDLHFRLFGFGLGGFAEDN